MRSRSSDRMGKSSIEGRPPKTRRGGAPKTKWTINLRRPLVALPELKKKPSGVFYLDLRGQGLGRVSLETRDRATAVAKRRDIVMGVEPVPKTEPSRPRGSGPSMKELLSLAEDTVWKDNKSQATIRS